MSRQLSEYLAARASGATLEQASARSGIPLAEAKLTEKAIEKGEVRLPTNQPPRRSEMAKKNDDQVKQVHAPDFARMKRIFYNDLQPANENNAKSRGDLSAAWGMIEKDCHCNKRAAKLLFKLSNESEETRDDFLRTLYGGMKALDIGISQDLVDKMEDADAPRMPVVASKGMGAEALATVN